MMQQKDLAKKYINLNGKEVYVYIGRVKCKMKHREYELSLNPATNEMGKYKRIKIKIKKTFFNGKTVMIEPMPLANYGVVRSLKINEEDIKNI